VNIETGYDMTCRVDRLGLKLVRSLVLIKYDSYHFYESSILPFDHPIMLRSVGRRKLMLDTFFIKIIFNLSVLELGVIVTFNSLDFGIKFILCPLQKFL
jgi:hypothetical protein